MVTQLDRRDRGCPHHCTFCYKDAFFEGGRGFYTQAVDDALAELARLPGRHLYFLDDSFAWKAAVRARIVSRNARDESRLSGRAPPCGFDFARRF
jgi:radical SAM superfamily enzyme YgiQ (UPF0313 family)